MVRTINKYEFGDAFKEGQYKNNFSYEGLDALFEYLEELEDGIGEEISFDVVAIACDYSEYKNINYAASDHSMTREELEDQATVIAIAGSDRVIIEAF